MTTDAWARARLLFEDLVERDARERASLLAAAGANDERLRAEVESLLAAHDRAGGFIEQPVYEAAADLLVDDALEGRLIGSYIVRHEIGRGGMGVVYLADETRLSRRVALKVLPPGLGRDRRLRERLRHEARAAATLSHPGIAMVYALEEIGDELYLACEYVPGPTLRALVESGPVPPADVVNMALQLARGLGAAHAQGVVHRDLKPENVVRTPAGVVKVLDFGLARLESGIATGHTLDDACGTAGYMAPEQIRGLNVDFRADLFAFGVLVYELACGSNPFAADTRTASMARVLEHDPVPLSQACPTAPPRLDAILTRCLNKDPVARYESTQALIAELERLQSDVLARNERHSPPWAIARSPRGWWEFHQAAVSGVYVLIMCPAWQVRSWLPRPWGTLFVLAVLSAAATAATLRLHVWFTSRFYLSELPVERRRTRRWTLWCDVAIAALLILATLNIAVDHQAVAMLLVTVAIAVALAASVIEPTTTRATFGS